MTDDVTAIDVADDVRPLLVVAAERVLTERQFRVFVGIVVFRLTQREVAAALGVSQPRVVEVLNGKRTHNGHKGGLMKKLIETLKDDAAFAAEVEKLKTQAAAAPLRSTLNWYRGIAPHHFASLAVLMVADEMATGRKQREVSVAELFDQIPRPVVMTALSTLRVLGFIATDGRTVRILRTPVQLKEVKA